MCEAERGRERGTRDVGRGCHGSELAPWAGSSPPWSSAWRWPPCFPFYVKVSQPKHSKGSNEQVSDETLSRCTILSFYLFQDVIDKLQEYFVHVEVILGTRFTEPHPSYLLCKLRRQVIFLCGDATQSNAQARGLWRGTDSSGASAFREGLGRKAWKVLFTLKRKVHKCSQFPTW